MDETQQDYLSRFKKKMAKGEPIEVPDMRELAGWRHLEQRGLVLDVVRRDVEDDRFNINVICYMKKPGQEKRVGEALGRVSAQFFGEMKPEYFDFIHFDQRQIQARVGAPLDTMNNFCIEIKHPISMMYHLESVRNHFLRELPKALELSV